MGRVLGGGGRTHGGGTWCSPSLCVGTRGGGITILRGVFLTFASSGAFFFNNGRVAIATRGFDRIGGFNTGGTTFGINVGFAYYLQYFHAICGYPDAGLILAYYRMEGGAWGNVTFLGRSIGA